MICHLALGYSIRNCQACRLLPWDREQGGGWLPCPNAAATPPPAPKRYLTPAEQRVMAKALRSSQRQIDPPPIPQFSGDICADCGSPSMVRTGTCMTCQDCGSSSGGCS